MARGALIAAWFAAVIMAAGQGVQQSRETIGASPTRSTQGDEAVGPFPSWTSVKTAYGAVGDGAADDTAAIQRGLTEVGTQNHSPVLFLPQGTYRITRTLTVTSTPNISVVGEDPNTTTIVWDGEAGGTMLAVDGVSYSRFSRLTFQGNRRASIAVDQSWNGTRPTFDTGNEYADDRLVDVEYGIHGGFKGYGFAETSIVRGEFVRNTKAGVALGNFNALDVWIWDSRFDQCATGVTNGSGAGNYHVYNSVFRQSTVSDMAMGNTGGFSARGNYSMGSRAFFTSVVSKTYPATIHLQRNTILDTTDPVAIDLRNQGPGLFTDNVIRTVASGFGPVIAWSGADGADVTSVGNTFTVANPISTNGRLIAIDDRTVARSAIDVAEPSLPGVPKNLGRQVFEVAAGARASAIQQAIDKAALQHGNRPIVHIPYGTYPISDTLTIPAGDIQLVGDGFGTILRWTGTGRGPVLAVKGPSRATLRELQIDGAMTSDGIVVDQIDQPGARVYLEQMQLRSGRQANVLIDGLNNALVDMRDVGYAYSPDAVAIKATGRSRTNIYSGASSGNRVSYDVSGGARVLVRDLWYESGAGPGFANVHGAATFTLDGARISSPVDAVPPAFDINGLNGSATILDAHIDDRIVVSGDGANARVLALGVVAERNAANYFLHLAMPPAHAFLLNSRQRRVGGPGNRSVPTANSDGVDAAFIRAQLAQTRGEMPAPLADLPASVSDFRVFRVWVSGGLANLTLRP